MMDTVLNLGLNEETRAGLAALSGDERFAWDAYRRFIQLFGRIVHARRRPSLRRRRSRRRSKRPAPNRTPT